MAVKVTDTAVSPDLVPTRADYRRGAWVVTPDSGRGVYTVDEALALVLLADDDAAGQLAELQRELGEVNE